MVMGVQRCVGFLTCVMLFCVSSAAFLETGDATQQQRRVQIGVLHEQFKKGDSTAVAKSVERPDDLGEGKEDDRRKSLPLETIVRLQQLTTKTARPKKRQERLERFSSQIESHGTPEAKSGSRETHLDWPDYCLAPRPTDNGTIGDEHKDLWEREAAATSYAVVANRCPRTKTCMGDKRKLCGDGLCCCCFVNANVYIANCSWRGNLRQLPQLPTETTVLDFSGNGLAAINGSDFFHNLTNLHHLDLGNNELTYIHPAAFSTLHMLSVLNLSRNNFLNFAKNSAAVTSIQSLVVLDINDCYGGAFTTNVFYSGRLPWLRELYLNNVDLRHWNATTFQVLNALQFLQLSRNDIRLIYTTYICKFKSLKYLDLSMNDLFFFPRSCQNLQPIYPNLEWLNLRNNHITVLSKDLCFPKLSVLLLDFNPIQYFETNMFATYRFPSMKCLKMEQVHVRKMERYVFNNTALRYLSLMYNDIDFSKQVQEDTFRGLPSLTLLQLEHNYISSRRFTELFGTLTALQYVYLGNTDMDYITRQTFAPFTRLESITLHRNNFAVVDDGVFDHLSELLKLDLSNCRINSIGPNTFSVGTRHRLRHLDLSGNPFVCDCNLLWFRNWLASKDPVFIYSYDTYVCVNHNDIAVEDFRINEQVCLMSRGTSQIIMVVVSFLLLILALVAVVFRYRWYIRLMLYETFRGKSHNCRLPDDHFRYDVFVCYADEDLDWVVNQLIPEVEVRHGVRLCIHNRDFMPGENITDNIFCSVQTSRHLLMVFSRHFARSQWCQFELALCLSHVVDNGETLLVACMDDVTSGGDMTPTMMAVMHTMTYIQWADGTESRATFWGRLKFALSDMACFSRS